MRRAGRDSMLAWLTPLRACMGLAFGLAVACSCQHDDELGELDGKLHAKVVWREKKSLKLAGGGHYVVVPTGVLTTHEGLLLVEAHDERPLPERSWSKHTRVELSEGPDAHRLAYRETGQSWRVAYVRDKEHVFLGLPVGPSLDWAAVPEFGDASLMLYSARDLNKQACVIDEVEKSGGARAVSKLLADSVDVESDDSWESAFGKLPEAERAAVQSVLEQRLLAQNVGPALGRALAFLPITDARFRDALLGVALKLAKDPKENQRLATRNRAALALRAAAADHPAAAAATACELLGLLASDDGVVRSALGVLTRAKASCPEAVAVLEKSLCEPALACLADASLGDGCGKVETPPAKADPKEAPFESTAQALATWSAALPELPSPLRSWQARTKYALEQNTTETCPGARAGAPCRCDPKAVKRALCKVDGKHAEAVACRFEVDDAAHRITHVESAFAGRYRAIALSNEYGNEYHGCGVDEQGAVSCFLLWSSRNEAVTIGRPKPIAGLSAAREIAAADTRVCVLTKTVECFELRKLASPGAPQAVDSFVEPVHDLVMAGLAVCGRGPREDVLCSRGSPLPAELIAEAAGAIRLSSTRDFLSAELPDKPPVYFGCDAAACRSGVVPGFRRVAVYSGRATGVTSDGKVVSFELLPQEKPERTALELKASERLYVSLGGTCGLSQGRLDCVAAEGERRTVLDGVRSLALDGEVALALRKDGSLTWFRMSEGKPRAVFSP